MISMMAEAFASERKQSFLGATILMKKHPYSHELMSK